jgi:RNA polymerase subunit RPABC4/transcription elongation factor Spt4
MPGYKRPCRFCGNLVEENSAVCPFCARAHPLQMVCPYCFAPIAADWTVCNQCRRPLIVACPKCGNPVGPDSDVCEKCRTVIRYRCPACAAVVPLGEKKCPRCNAKLKEFWKSQER